MEQLANMPVWAQILSMGSFMFASGVLMTRLPFAPVLILLVFGLIENIVPKHFWSWVLGVSVVVVSLIGLAFLLLKTASTDASNGIGIGLAGIWLLVLFVASMLIVPLVVFIVGTVIRFGQWYFSLQLLPWQGLLALFLFGIGVLYGIIDWTSFGWNFLRVIFVVVLSVGLCASGLLMSTGGFRTGLIMILVCLLAWAPLVIKREYIEIIGVGGYDAALLNATSVGNIKAVDTLLEKGADVNATDKFNWTPLHNAVHGYHTELVKLLLEKGADVNAATKSGSTALYMAADKPSVKMVKLLLEHGADVNTIIVGEKLYNTALSVALMRNSMEVVKVLLEKGADTNIANSNGETPLLQIRNLETWQLLLDHGANVNAQNSKGETALIQIIQSYDEDGKKTKFLLEHGADVNIRDKKGKTALDYAISSDYLEYDTNNPNRLAVEKQIKLLKQYGAKK